MTYITKALHISKILGIFLERIEHVIYEFQAFSLVILVIVVIKRNDFLIIV